MFLFLFLFPGPARNASSLSDFCMHHSQELHLHTNADYQTERIFMMR